MPRISCTCDCNFSSFRHLNFHSGFEPICSYPSVQKSCKVPCFFCFFLFYLAVLLLYLFLVSLPSLLCFQWRLRAARLEFDSLKMQRFLLSSTVLRQTTGTIQFRAKELWSSMFVLFLSVLSCSPSTIFISCIPSIISLFPMTITGCKTGVRLPENTEISTFFYSALANDRNGPLHPFSTWETLKAVKGPGFEPDPSSSDKGYKCVELYLHSRD